ncbi:DUF1822 family protein [Calothrix sp. FACHB-1219]|uniref:DUF1822 family protein n=1 Tax=unclassified Calothrix TaxID=2619626 RepID=UPI001689E091|nr:MULTISPECIES: DUF1822 family protein [unclassified Calothrix]MBD2204536.1 DUF1822 family protein [Calothrix sp. FACHB-168]MBD2219334.1 DUF1822 family protein [Calothrix sp. FACHB-1219]
MINNPTPDLDLTDDLDWYPLNETQTELLPEHLNQAIRLSQSIHLSQQRWEVYLCALGTLGFTQWLKERAPDLEIHSDAASIWQPATANLLAAACNIQVGAFKICVITASVFNDKHSIPHAVLEIPDLAAHFYVLMQVQEEEQQVAISGFMNYEQYRSYQQTARLQIERDWTYTLPQSCFNSNPNALLLNLRCLNPDAIHLPASIPVETNKVVALKQKLIRLKPQLKKQYLWDLLTVNESITLFSNPDLINWVYQAAKPSLLQPIINVGAWLNNQIDTVTQELGWLLMPLPAFSEMRSLRYIQESFDPIRASLEQQGVYIPASARGAYRDLDSEHSSVRMYAITWELTETPDNPEWTLLIVLGSKPQAAIPNILTLEVRDETQQLFQQSLTDTNQGILYAQVIGNLNEQFAVIVTADDNVFEIPPFGLGVGARG